jgi:uncharacterized protein with GYD domain
MSLGVRRSTLCPATDGELGSTGNIRTLTLRAYDREEMSGIIGRLG